VRPVHTLGVAAALVAVALGAPPAGAQTIPVTPGSPHPGQRVHISVPDCGAGRSPHTATSAAFASTVTLYGKSDTGEADPTIRRDLAPGTYPITAFCDASRTVRGQVVVTGITARPSPQHAASVGSSPAASRTPHDSTGAYWVLGAVAAALAAGAAVMLIRARSTDRR
jgi:hypothetical protein